MTDSTISGNTARRGGGIYTLGGASITRSTISGNFANDAGGGIEAFGHLSHALTNVTVSGNSALTSAGGILVEHSASLDLITHLINFDLNVQDAIGAPRFRWVDEAIDPLPAETLRIESRVPEATRQDLAERG